MKNLIAVLMAALAVGAGAAPGEQARRVLVLADESRHDSLDDSDRCGSVSGIDVLEAPGL